MTLEGERVRLRPLEVGDADELLRVNLENREFFAARESRRPGEYYTLDVQRARVEEAQKMLAESSGALFGVFLSASEELIGILGLFGVIRGGFQEARIGYMIAERHSGQGHATEAVRLSLPFAFETLGLHRLETGVQLDNPASMRVLTKAGFRDEGISPSWVKIADAWVDCKRFALTREEWEERARPRSGGLGAGCGAVGRVLDVAAFEAQERSRLTDVDRCSLPARSAGLELLSGEPSMQFEVAHFVPLGCTE